MKFKKNGKFRKNGKKFVVFCRQNQLFQAFSVANQYFHDFYFYRNEYFHSMVTHEDSTKHHKTKMFDI